jgi:hypothetical protein
LGSALDKSGGKEHIASWQALALWHRFMWGEDAVTAGAASRQSESHWILMAAVSKKPSFARSAAADASPTWKSKDE